VPDFFLASVQKTRILLTRTMTETSSQTQVKPLADEWVADTAASAVLDCCRFAEVDDVAALVELIGGDLSLCDCQDDLGRTPLHMAAANGHAHIVKTLLEFKPAKNKPNDEGNTALHYSALHNHVECARLLLEAGWKVSVRNRFGRTALQEISERQFEEMEVLLMKYDDDLDTYDNAAAVIEVSDGTIPAEPKEPGVPMMPTPEPQKAQGGLDDLE
jgi:ankyrin repeat protein